MSKRRTRGLGEALRIAGESKTPAVALGAGAPHGVDQRPAPPARVAPQQQRGQRKGRTGVVVYLDSNTHFELKRLALESRCSRQELCTRGVTSLLKK